MTNTKLVSLESVMEILGNASSAVGYNQESTREFHNLSFITMKIQQLPTIDDGWISVEERLPEQKDFYTGCKIAYYRENYTIVVSSPNATLQCIESCIGFTPTHWYELPAKPCKHPQMTVEKYVKK